VGILHYNFENGATFGIKLVAESQARAHLNKHKHHATKHHKTGKKSLRIKLDKK
jgi:hypothetical protein